MPDLAQIRDSSGIIVIPTLRGPSLTREQNVEASTTSMSKTSRRRGVTELLVMSGRRVVAIHSTQTRDRDRRCGGRTRVLRLDRERGARSGHRTEAEGAVRPVDRRVSMSKPVETQG